MLKELKFLRVKDEDQRMSKRAYDSNKIEKSEKREEKRREEED